VTHKTQPRKKLTKKFQDLKQRTTLKLALLLLNLKSVRTSHKSLNLLRVKKQYLSTLFYKKLNGRVRKIKNNNNFSPNHACDFHSTWLSAIYQYLITIQIIFRKLTFLTSFKIFMKCSLFNYNYEIKIVNNLAYSKFKYFVDKKSFRFLLLFYFSFIKSYFDSYTCLRILLKLRDPKILRQFHSFKFLFYIKT